MLYHGARHFNPRSLTGATRRQEQAVTFMSISIHAPLRERRKNPLPADCWSAISIHAPSRERLPRCKIISFSFLFQSTLPRGSDLSLLASAIFRHTDFNPRSLAGATWTIWNEWFRDEFQSTLPRGSDISVLKIIRIKRDFNPRSLAGATG